MKHVFAKIPKQYLCIFAQNIYMTTINSISSFIDSHTLAVFLFIYDRLSGFTVVMLV
jgi:hypothetical protein